VPKKRFPKRRSTCPLNASVEMLGDRWSLLILRDMMLRGSSTFKEFLDSYERIATNVLTDRLRKLAAYGIISSHPDPSDGRKLIYTLTAKGIDLAPVLTEMVLWAARHEDTGNQALIQLMQADKEKFLADIRLRCSAQLSPSLAPLAPAGLASSSPGLAYNSRRNRQLDG
jgi:DNA-binding HxlR family transcriptional regulator